MDVTQCRIFGHELGKDGRCEVCGYFDRVMRAATQYRCKTCGETAPNLAAARKHAKQGYRTQREAFQAGSLHSLSLEAKP